MSREGLSMRKIREVLRLRLGVGLSLRQVADSCKVSVGTVSEYEKRVKAARRHIHIHTLALEILHIRIRVITRVQTHLIRQSPGVLFDPLFIHCLNVLKS